MNSFPIDFVKSLIERGGEPRNLVVKGLCCFIKKHAHCPKCDVAYDIYGKGRGNGYWHWIYMCEDCWDDLSSKDQGKIIERDGQGFYGPDLFK